MSDAEERGARLPPWLWILLIIGSGAAVFAVTGMTAGFCSDSADPVKSICESGPLIGVAGVWIAWLGWVALAALAIRRLMRRR